MATAACAPSAIATATSRTSRDTVARDINAGDARLLSIWIGHNTALHIPLAAETLGKIGRLMAAGRKE